MSTFITRFDSSGPGLRLAIKDLIDVQGQITTAGCKAAERLAKPALRDAACLSGARDAERRGNVRMVGKANLHELAFGGTGLNPWYGNPVNPLDPARIPGGSSSGSAVAVATDEADVAYGSDTGGSIRTPSACCGTAGLKTTFGRVPLDGVWPLAPSLDTVGPMARNVEGLVAGMQLLEPGFVVAASPPAVLGRFRGLDTDPQIDAALDRALATSELEIHDVELPGWGDATGAAVRMLVGEAWRTDGDLLRRHPEGIAADVAARLRLGQGITDDALAQARAVKATWRAELRAVFDRVELIALPTLVMLPPGLSDSGDRTVTANAAVNLAGHPALALPVPLDGVIAASLQLVGPDQSEGLLLAAGRVIEGAVASL